MRNLLQKEAIICVAAGLSQIDLIKRIKSSGYAVIGVDRNPNAPGFKYCDEVIIESTHEPEKIIEHLKTLIKNWMFKGVITASSGLPAVTTAKIADYFGLITLKPTLVQNITNKGDLLKSLNKLNIPSPKVHVVNSAEDFAPFEPPYFVKPSISYRTHSGMMIVQDKSLLSTAVDSALNESLVGSVNIEQFIEGRDVCSIDWIYDNKIIHVITMEEINSGAPYYYGLGWKTPLSNDISEATEYTQNMLFEKMNLNNCLLQTSMKYHEGKAMIYEIHLDIGGDGIPDIFLPKSIGYNLIEDAILLCTGKKPNGPSCSVAPTVLRFILESDLSHIDESGFYTQVKKLFGGVKTEFLGLIGTMNNEKRIGAILFQAENSLELNKIINHFEIWFKEVKS